MLEGSIARSERDDAAPRVLGKYTLIGQIGEGGMARIYLARTRSIGGFEKLVVVKLVLPRLAEDGEFVERFLQEARLTASLDHPNIAAVHDVDCEGSTYYYAMEYVRGRDLHKVLRRASLRQRVLSLAEIVGIVAPLCAGLHHAHTRVGPDGRPLGIVHRDVSPSNVLVGFEGAVKLADFGVAKARVGMIATEAGTLRGKIAYMSPEQCRGEGLDARSDVYAVGALLWELLTLRRLHQGDSELAMMRRIADDEAASPVALRPDTPAALERIVGKALARAPAERHASAEALAAELEELARELKLSVGPRTVAALMQELFAEEIEHEVDGDHAPTVALRAGDPGGPPTPPTGTLPPPRPLARPVIDEHPTQVDLDDAIVVGPRRWTGLAIGLALGAVLGGGGLYLALQTSPDPAVEPAASAAVPRIEPVPVAAPIVVAPAASRDRVAPTPARPTPAPVESVTVGERPGADKARREGSRSRARRRRAAARERARDRSLDLDAPLPPGFPGR